MRIGFLDHPPAGDVAADPECAAAVTAVAETLESLGHRVEAAHPAALDDPEAARRFTTIVAAGTAADVAWLTGVVGRPLTADDLERSNLRLAEIGRELSAPDYLAAEMWLQRWCRRVVEWWHPLDGSAGFDVLVSPVLNGPPPPIGWLTEPKVGTKRLFAMLQYTSQFNLTGQPAVSLPLHWTPDGLPVGVQFVGGFGREDVLVRLAAQLESAVPWRDRRPPPPF